MKILLYCINYSPELTGAGKYSGEMAPWMASQGHDVRVVTAPPYYPDWKVRDGFSAWRYKKTKEKGVTIFRCPLYVPRTPTTLKRLIHLLSFSLSSSLAIFSQLLWKPELVILVAPTLFCAPQTLLLSRITGAKSVLHVQDYEVDALFGLGISKNEGGFKKLAFMAERLILGFFDRVSTISGGMLQRASQKGVVADRLLFFPNWSEVTRFRNIHRCDELLKRLGVATDKRIFLYSGNIGEKQGLETVIEAAELERSRSDWLFLIVGDGAGKSRLLELVNKKRLSNVQFAPLQTYEDLPALLASADGHLIIQKRGAADAVLPSKLTNILAVGGNAVITADPDTSLGLLCAEHRGIAVLVEPESAKALVEGIECLLAMPSHNAVATNYAKTFLDKDQVLHRFLLEV